MDHFDEKSKDSVDKEKKSDDSRASERSDECRATPESREDCTMNEENACSSSAETNDSATSGPLVESKSGDASPIKVGAAEENSRPGWIEDEQQESRESWYRQTEVIPGNTDTDESAKSSSEESRSLHKKRYKPIESFEELPLSSQLLQNIRSSLIKKPNETQRKTLPLLFQSPARNIYIRTWPGTGKKTAFLINILHRIEPDLQRTQAIIVAPSAELVDYIAWSAKDLARGMNIQVFQVSGQDKERPRHRTDDHLVVTTIGTCMWMKEIRLLDFSKVKCLVFDELDLLMNCKASLESSINLIRMLNGTAHQLLFFSTSLCDKILRLVKGCVEGQMVVREILSRSFAFDFLQFHSYSPNNHEREKKLLKILGCLINGRIIIYTLGWKPAERVADLLKENGFKVILITNQTQIQERVKEMSRFNSSKGQIVLCINYPIGQGIPLEDVNVVINYDLPRQEGFKSIEYMHRMAKCNTVNGRPAFIINLTDFYSEKLLKHLQRNYRMIDLKVECD